MMFLSMTKGARYDESLLSHIGVDGLLTVPVSVESFLVPQDILSSFFTCLASFKGVGKTERKPVEDFIADLKRHDALLSAKVPLG